jgi:hypothetical protein
VVGKPYRRVARLIGVAISLWPQIEAACTWQGIDPWNRSLYHWCILVDSFVRSRLEADAEALARYDTTMSDPVEDSRLYTLIRQRVPTNYDSGFAAAMSGLERARG